MRWLLILVLSCLTFAAQAQADKPFDIAIMVLLDRSKPV